LLLGKVRVAPQFLTLLCLTFYGSSEPNEPSAAEVHVHRVMELRGQRFSRAKRKQLARAILESSEEHAVDPRLVLAVIEVESSFRPRALSSRGALGLMQLLPNTARHVARKMGRRINGASLYDPALNVRLGTFYLARLTAFFDGDLDLALTAYCYGPIRVQRMVARRGRVPARWLDYARAVERELLRHEALIDSRNT
jgi:soluble lytic murein transglycosylase-like protein